MFTPDTDIPDLSGKVIIVTGGSSGLGKESVHQLAKHNPARIFLGARTAKRGNAAIQEIESAVPSMKGRISYLEMDLASFASIQRATKTFQSQSDRLDILMNNAGVMAQPEGLTEDGYEIQFGSNYMGPALFTKLLWPTLQKTAEQPKSDVRVNKTTLPGISSLARYSQAKLADYYHTINLANTHPEIKLVAIHPGVVNTGIFDDLKARRPYLGAVLGLLGGLFLTDVHKGARAQLWAATAPSDKVRSGGFYNPALKEYDHALLKDKALAEKLESWTETEFRSKGF